MSVSYVCAREELLPSGGQRRTPAGAIGLDVIVDPLTMPVYRQLSYRG